MSFMKTEIAKTSTPLSSNDNDKKWAKGGRQGKPQAAMMIITVLIIRGRCHQIGYCHHNSPKNSRKWENYPR